MFKKRGGGTSDNAPTMRGTEGTPCFEDKDRTLKKKKLCLREVHADKNSADRGTMEKCFLTFNKQMTKMRMKSPAFSTLKLIQHIKHF